MATYTPVTHWMAMPMRELGEWVDACLKIQGEDARTPQAGS